MNTVMFPKDMLVEELDLPYNDSIIKHEAVIDTTRWSTVYEIVFEHDGKFWLTSYSTGSTEQQDEQPWEYEDEVECTEVEHKEVRRMMWVPTGVDE